MNLLVVHKVYQNEINLLPQIKIITNGDPKTFM